LVFYALRGVVAARRNDHGFRRESGFAKNVDASHRGRRHGARRWRIGARRLLRVLRRAPELGLKIVLLVLVSRRSLAPGERGVRGRSTGCRRRRRGVHKLRDDDRVVGEALHVAWRSGHEAKRGERIVKSD
jgi:hypothetical protein